MNPTYLLDTAADKALIDRASNGSLEAFNVLVLRYQNIAYHQAYVLVGDVFCAEDVTQISFIKAFRSMRNFRGGSFRAWLLRIVTNTAYDILRKTRQHPTQPLLPEDDDGEQIESPTWLIDPASSVELIIEQQEEAKHIHQLINELPPLYRSVLILVDMYEMGYEEVAGVLNIPIGTVKSRLARARLQMRHMLQALDRIGLISRLQTCPVDGG